MKYTQDLRAFGSNRENETVLTIKDVYNHYYTAYLKSENKFYKFIPTDDGVKQQVWDNESKRMTLVPLQGEYTIITGYSDDGDAQYGKAEVNSEGFWKGFFKLYKKTYDIKVETDVTVSPIVYDSASKSKIPSPDTEFVIQGVAASKLRNIILSCVDEYALEEATKNKDFNWEEKYKEKLKGLSFKFSVTGEKLETKYTFKNATPKQAVAEKANVEEVINIDDLPF